MRGGGSIYSNPALQSVVSNLMVIFAGFTIFNHHFAKSLTLLNIFFVQTIQNSHFLASVLFISGTFINYPLLYVILTLSLIFEYFGSGIFFGFLLILIIIWPPVSSLYQIYNTGAIINYCVPLTLIRRRRRWAIKQGPFSTY